jgi:hypothetical protein
MELANKMKRDRTLDQKRNWKLSKPVCPKRETTGINDHNTTQLSVYAMALAWFVTHTSYLNTLFIQMVDMLRGSWNHLQELVLEWNQQLQQVERVGVFA